MDQTYLERFRERSAAETARTAPPDGFPPLPDLPLGRYTDPEFFRLETERLFRRAWLYAIHDSELAEPGAYALREIAGAPVLLVRGDDDRTRGRCAGPVRAFYNACRHRGAPVVKGDSGCARLLVCQYHSWTYGLDGALLRVPDERDFVGLDPEQRGLPTHPVRAVGRLVVRQPRPRRGAAARVARPDPHAARRRRPARRCGTSTTKIGRARLQLEDPRRGLPRGVPRPHGAPHHGRAHARHARHGDLAVRPRPPEHALAGEAGHPRATVARRCRRSPTCRP